MMADTKELTENEQRALKEYATSPGWYEYPGYEGSLRKNELLELLDGDEFTEADPLAEANKRINRAYGVDPDAEPEESRGVRVEQPDKPRKAPSSTDPSAVDTFAVDVSELRFGSKHHGVIILKALLALLAYPCNRTPAFDGECERAVMEFQSDERIPVTGVVDGKTWERLLKADRPVG